MRQEKSRTRAVQKTLMDSDEIREMETSRLLSEDHIKLPAESETV